MAAMPRRSGSLWLKIALAGALLAACALGAGLLLVLVRPASGLMLTNLGLPTVTDGPCPNLAAAAPTGPALSLVTEGVVATDLVQVQSQLTQAGWATAGYMTNDIQLRPTGPAALPLGFMQVMFYRGVELSYTVDHQTHLSSWMAVVVCPP